MNLEDIENCFHILMEHARSGGVTQLDLRDRDFYWTIVSPDWLNIYVEPKPSVGSLRDDHEELVKLLHDPSRASAVDLERLAHLIRYLSDELVR